MGNGQWMMDDGQWIMDNGQWIMDNGRWIMDNGQCPDLTYAKPACRLPCRQTGQTGQRGQRGTKDPKERLQNSLNAIILYYRQSPLVGTACFLRSFLSELSYCVRNGFDQPVTGLREARKKRYHTTGGCKLYITSPLQMT